MTSADVVCAVEHLTFSYHPEPKSPHLFHDLSLTFKRGEPVAIMGTSGSGKSTLGKLLTRVISPTSGRIRWSEEFLPPHEVMYTDQTPMSSVFPWQTVTENLTWPLRKRRWSAAAADERTSELLKLFRLEHVHRALPRHISGGELQRLAVARCTSWRPKALVLDESLSSLDRHTKKLVTTALRAEIDRSSLLVVLITHNLSEALSIADRCVVLGEDGAGVIADRPIAIPSPRFETSDAYQSAQESMLEVLKHGLL
jgi:NitT/TauT family transport system ATP-binding protein